MSTADEEMEGPQTDATVVAAVRAGDVNAFESLVTRYQRQVLALGLRFLRSREDAEDFVQEVFLQAFRKLHTWKGTGRFYSWLMRIAYTRGARRKDGRPPHEALAEPVTVDPSVAPDECAEREEARRAVLAAMRRLPPRYGDCIGLYYFFGLSYKEVSEVTHYRLNTVRSHIRRAKRMLAEELAPYAETPADRSDHDVP